MKFIKKYLILILYLLLLIFFTYLGYEDIFRNNNTNNYIIYILIITFALFQTINTLLIINNNMYQFEFGMISDFVTFIISLFLIYYGKIYSTTTLGFVLLIKVVRNFIISHREIKHYFKKSYS